MLPIVNIDYEQALREIRKQGYKCAVFFLYSEYSQFYNSDLSNKYEELDCQSGRKVAFVTHFTVTNYPERGSTSDFALKHWRKRIGYDFSEKGKWEENDLGFKTMRNIARAFECGMENRFPCFVIFDPNNPQFFVEKSSIGADDIFVEVSHIITDIQSVGYDIRKYAETFNQRHYYLSAEELLERNIHAIFNGISIEEIKEAAKADNIKNCIDWTELDRLQKRGGIKPKKFYHNLNTIIKGNIPEGNITRLIDKYLGYYEREEEMAFPEIKRFVNETSIEYLKIANCFEAGTFDVPERKASLVAICLGKVVEDELNLGIYNVFRGAFDVRLPQYYDIFQKDRGRLEVPFDNANDRDWFTFYLNKRARDCSDTVRLEYPKVSETRKVAFDNNYVVYPEDINASDRVNQGRAKIAAIRKQITTDNWDTICAEMETIAELRNRAIHRPSAVDRQEAVNSLQAFQNLVNIKFFEVNSELKKIVTS